MKKHTLLICAIASGATLALAATVPFTENFVGSSAAWRGSDGATELDWLAAGGPDGSSYASGTFNFANSFPDDTPAILRGQAEWFSSGNAFVGDYISENVTQFNAMVRHDAPMPLNFFVRFSSPFNFPGAVGVIFIPALPGEWTPISIALEEGNPQFITFETADFGTVFGNIGNVQVGVSVPAPLAGSDQDYTFDIDQITISGPAVEPPTTVPAMSPLGMAVLIGALGIGVARIRRKSR